MPDLIILFRHGPVLTRPIWIPICEVGFLQAWSTVSSATQVGEYIQRTFVPLAVDRHIRGGYEMTTKHKCDMKAK